MVRRDATTRADTRSDDDVARCASPAGESPVPVSAGAPGSGPRTSEGDLDVQAGRRKPSAGHPVRREQARGPQHDVKPAASKDRQSGGRAAHVTAKATLTARAPERAAGPG